MAFAGSVFARDDTFFGACYALGEDFGFNPTYLRLLFALILFWSPVGALGAYAACLVAVMLSRWLAPNPAPAEDACLEEETGAEWLEPEELKLAA